MFHKYQHVERLGSDDTAGLLIGEVHIQPKVDGSNGVIWWEGEVRCGSRNRELDEEHENQGFRAYVMGELRERLASLFDGHHEYILHGEWAVPHSLKTYRQEFWQRFWVFDVCVRGIDDEVVYIPYKEYQPVLEKYGIDYLPVIASITNAILEDMEKCLERATFMLESGLPEGIVIKNYDFRNKYGRICWGKIVTQEFKDKHVQAMGGSAYTRGIGDEQEFASKLTEAMVDKIVEKIRVEKDGFNSRDIPRLLSTAYHDLVTEEMWSYIKSNKKAVIDFRLLSGHVSRRVKEVKPELFGGVKVAQEA